MDIRELKYFLAVAKEENISKAANYLYITQPSLTRQMQNLEKEIGKPLFVKTNRKIKLTPIGNMLRKRAQEIVDLYDKTQYDLLSTDNISGNINIGSGESYAVETIADIAQNTQAQYPNIKFNFFSGNTNAICEKLDNGLIDFGIVIEPVDLSNYDYLQLPCIDKWGILTKKDDPIAQKQHLTAEELARLPLIFSQHAFDKEPLKSWLNGMLDNYNIVATYNLLYNASLLVKANLGYAVCIDKIINTGKDSDFAFIPFYPQVQSRLYIAWKKHQIFSSASQVFLNNLHQMIDNSILDNKANNS